MGCFYMKIFNYDNRNIDKIMQAYNKQEVSKGSTRSSRISRNDELRLSDVAKDYQLAMNAIKKVPDIRKEKVETIKQQIKTGTYVVDAGKIAEKMLEEINFDKKV